MDMQTGDFINFGLLTVGVGGLIVSLLQLGNAQRKANALKQAEIDVRIWTERRTEYKLRIYLSLMDQRLSFDELISKFREHTPLTEVDQIELRKCIYEMLVDDTLVAYEDRTYMSNVVEEEEENENRDNA